MKAMPRISKLIVLNRKREDIIGWYEALEIPCNRDLSTEKLIENLYQTFQTNSVFYVHIKPEKERLSRQELKWLKKFFEADLEYIPGPLYVLPGTFTYDDI